MKVYIHSAEQMKEFGEKIGRAVNGGEFIELVGDVGAGKTTFTKGLANGLGIAETVQSPTFTISRVYEGRDDLTLAHYDFYRLADAGIMADELAETIAEPKTVTVIEWGEVVADVRPEDHFVISIESPTETDRTVTLRAHGERAELLIGAIA